MDMTKQTRSKGRNRIAKNLRAAREALGPTMTQDRVAKLFTPPISRAAVAQWELEEGTMPDVDRLVVLSKAYGVTIDSLIFGNGTSQASKNLGADALKVARAYEKLDPKQRKLWAALINKAAK